MDSEDLTTCRILIVCERHDSMHGWGITNQNAITRHKRDRDRVWPNYKTKITTTTKHEMYGCEQ